MATIVLSAVGAAAGASIGGGLLGLSSVAIGRAVGAIAGSMIDQAVMGDGSQTVEHGRVDRFRLTGVSEGTPIAQVYGRMRLGGQVIWASGIREHATAAHDSDGGSGKGVLTGTSASTSTIEYRYTMSLAIALCEGEITRVGRIWVDGSEIEPDSLSLRVYKGTEWQQPDPKIEAVEGAGNAPAYRGVAYVVIEELDLTAFNNRVPVFNFEVFRPEQRDEDAEIARGTKAVAIIPGTGEYALATRRVHVGSKPGERRPVNENTPLGKTDFAASLEMLDEAMPNLEAASLVVSWFGDDLRCAQCQITPRVESHGDDGQEMPWTVSGIARTEAGLVPYADNRPVYGGTPTDQSVVQAIRALKAAGKAVTFYPFILMTQMAGNAKPDPWTGTAGQPALPWRGRITLSAAPGQPGSPDQTATAAQEVADFFGQAGPDDFEITEATATAPALAWGAPVAADTGSALSVAYSGPQEWSYRRFILHYAHLCKAAGGVEAFLIGSEMRGLSQVRGAAGGFPTVARLKALAADVRAVLGPKTKISYAADWSEYFGYHPGNGDVFFHLDPLWSDANIDFVGIDNYMPLSDWRDGPDHADADWGSIYDLDYLKANILGGEGYEWYYHTPEAERLQLRTAITDGAYGKDWVFRNKDLPSWWSNSHHNRISQVVPSLSGGTVSTVTDQSDGSDYIVHTFTDSGTLTVSSETEVEVLIVGGGGGGSTGGGGAGGIVQERFTLSAGTWPVTVGAGGAGIHGGALPRPTPASNGADSSFAGLIALGGGGGAGTDYNGIDGGSGGGAASSSKPANPSSGGAGLQPGAASGGSGFAGGAVTRFSTPYYAGGGGGAGGAGQTEAGAWTPGGIGITTTIAGAAQNIGGGGAGGNWTGGTGLAGTHGGGSGGSENLRNAMPNTGGGGGGGSYTAVGGTGGSGLVVVRYLVPQPVLVEQEPTEWVPGSKPIWFTEIGCAAIDKGTNQPNKFLDPKSSESSLPKYSNGGRDDFIQMRYLRALREFWADPANNPTDAETGVQMLDMSRAHVWAWDARPFPWFPARRGLWSDGGNYERGHWLNGRESNRSLASVVSEICTRSGLAQHDVSRLWGVVRGYGVDAVTGGRNALQPLMLAHRFEAAERDGELGFFTRTGLAGETLDAARLAVSDELDGTLEVIRAPEAETAGRVRLNFIDASAAYQLRATEAVFADEPTHAVSQSELPMVLTRAEGRGIVERWLAEARVARDRAAFMLPPSDLGLAAGDVVRFDLPGGPGNFRIDRIEQGSGALVRAVRVEPGVFAPAEGLELETELGAYIPPVPVLPLFLDLPLLTGEEVAHAPRLAVTALPWPGPVAVLRGQNEAGYKLVHTVGSPARVGVSETRLPRARPGVIDRGPALRVRMTSGDLASADLDRVLSGANAAVIGDGSADNWEVFQFTTAELVAEGIWEISGRLRGQAGTDATMPEAWPVGSYLVILDAGVAQITHPASLRGLERDFLIGPAARPYDDDTYVHKALAFTGIGLRPLAPVHLTTRARAGGDLSVSWIRRTRIDGDSWLGEEVPLGEASERYRVRVMGGLTMLREAEVSAQGWVYTAQMQADDGVSGAFAIEVAQVSASFGPGPYARVGVA